MAQKRHVLHWRYQHATTLGRLKTDVDYLYPPAIDQSVCNNRFCKPLATTALLFGIGTSLRLGLGGHTLPLSINSAEDSLSDD